VTRERLWACLLALKLYVTPLMVVLRASIPVPEVKNRNLPVPDESRVNSMDRAWVGATLSGLDGQTDPAAGAGAGPKR